MSISWLIFYGLTILFIIICLDKSTESITIVGEMLKILISGYLGYLVRRLEEKS